MEERDAHLERGFGPAERSLNGFDASLDRLSGKLEASFDCIDVRMRWLIVTCVIWTTAVMGLYFRR